MRRYDTDVSIRYDCGDDHAPTIPSGLEYGGRCPCIPTVRQHRCSSPATGLHRCLDELQRARTGGRRTRRRPAAAADRRRETEGGEVSLTRRADWRYTRRLLPGIRDAGVDARIRRISDGDPSAAGADHHRLRGAQRDPPRLSRRPHRARGGSAAGPEWPFERSMGRQHAGRRNGQPGRAGRSAICPQQQGEDRRALSSRQRREGRDRARGRDDDDRSRVLHGAVHDGEEVGEGAERASAPV